MLLKDFRKNKALKRTGKYFYFAMQQKKKQEKDQEQGRKQF